MNEIEDANAMARGKKNESHFSRCLGSVDLSWYSVLLSGKTVRTTVSAPFASLLPLYRVVISDFLQRWRKNCNKFSRMVDSHIKMTGILTENFEKNPYVFFNNFVFLYVGNDSYNDIH